LGYLNNYVKSNQALFYGYGFSELGRKKIDIYARTYWDHFTCGRKNSTSRCEQYLKGLFHECKSNVERMQERIPGSDYEQLQYFVSESDWDAQGVMMDVA
jgi:hypothetical protein